MSQDQSNLPEPYHLTSGDNRFSYSFITDKENEYIINLIDYTNEYPNEEIGDSTIYEFQFLKVKGDDKTLDLRVMSTIIYCIDKILQNESNVILYICDSDENSPASRAQLFDRWFRKYSDDKAHKIDGELIGIDGTKQYISVIVNRNNPNFNRIAYMFNIILNDIDRGKNASFIV